MIRDVLQIPHGLIERFQSSAPVDVHGLAAALGLKIKEDSRLQIGISGMISQIPHPYGQYEITVRASDPLVRKRFTIAHEIAHYILHRDRIGVQLIDDAMYRSGLSSREESEANRLAADILMPRHLISQYSQAFGTGDASVLASAFQVSEDAMRIKLGLRRTPTDRTPIPIPQFPYGA